jgi:hypothetical protein
VFGFEVAGDKIKRIWAVRNPDKLRPGRQADSVFTHRVRYQLPMPAGNSMPGTETRPTDVGGADAIAAHRPPDADAFARREPSRPAPMPAGAVQVPGTGPDMSVTLPGR